MENLAGGPLIAPETWSWSEATGVWYPNSPLWNVILGFGFQSAGYWGFFLVTALALLALFGVSYALARLLGARRLPALLGLLGAYLAAFAMLSPRATVAAEIVLLVGIYGALRWSQQASRFGPVLNLIVALTAATALSVLGNWLHLSFLLLAPAMAVVWLAIWLLTPGLARATRWALILAGGAGWGVGVLLSPYGVWGGLARSQAVRDACEGIITEWSGPFVPGVSWTAWVPAIAVAVVASGALWWCYRRLRTKRRDLATRGLVALTLIGAPAAIAGMTAIRFLGLGLLTLAPVAAVALSSAAVKLRPGAKARFGARGEEYLSGKMWRVLLTAVSILLLPGVLLLGAQHSVPAERGLTQQLPADCQFFGAPGIAGAVILDRPDVQVWIDGRADFYGRTFMIDTATYFNGVNAELVPPGTTCLIVDQTSPLTNGLAERLAASDQWRPTGRSGDFVLWLPA